MIAIPKKDRENSHRIDPWVPSREFIHAKTAEIQRTWTPDKRRERAELAQQFMQVFALSCPSRDR
jgi:hypothetical protein